MISQVEYEICSL